MQNYLSIFPSGYIFTAPMSSLQPVETSHTLLEAVASGNNAAWVKFVSRYQPLLLQRCRQMGLSPDDADCLTQDIFLELFKRLKRFSRQRTGSFRKWLTIIVRTRILDRKRNNRLRTESWPDIDFVESLLPSISESADEAQKDAQVTKLITAIRSNFTDRDWAIFYLTVGEERKPVEVAETIGVTENTIYLTKSRMLKKIRTLYSTP